MQLSTHTPLQLEEHDDGSMTPQKLQVVEGKSTELPVTMTVKHLVLPGRETQFLEWLDRMAVVAGNNAGYLGHHVIPPREGGVADQGSVTERVFMVLVRFNSVSNLETFEVSEAKARMINELSDAGIVSRSEVLNGAERKRTMAFGIVDKSSFLNDGAQPLALPPPKWKNYLLVVANVWMLVSTLIAYSGWLQSMAKAGIPIELGLLLALFVIVPLLQYVFVPLEIKYLFKNALMRGATGWQWEPCRSLETGLPCFEPDPHVKNLTNQVKDLQQQNSRLIAVVNSRLDRLEAGVLSPVNTMRDSLPPNSQSAPHGDGSRGALSANQIIAHQTATMHKQATIAAAGGAGAAATAAAAGGGGAAAAAAAAAAGSSGSEVTCVLRQLVQPGKGHEFERWVNKVANHAHAHAPGFIGASLIRPDDAHEPYVVILRFDNHQNLENWMDAPARRAFLEDAQPFLAGIAEIAVTSDSCPLDMLFDVDVNAFGIKSQGSGVAPRRPPLWKICITTIIALYIVLAPSSLFIQPRVDATGIHKLLVTLVMAMFNVFCVTYITAPLIGMWLHRWLSQPRPIYVTQPMKFFDEGFPFLK